jgi:glycosyltransferase involved in cell wall biosynthesis
VPAVASFLHNSLQQSDRYRSDLISMAVSSVDSASVRLVSPRSWWRGPHVACGNWQGIPFRHAGAHAVEFEIARYMPRRQLTSLLEGYDLIQVVAGTPTFGFPVISVNKPKCLSVATTIHNDRESALAQASGVRKIWHFGMTAINVILERRVLCRMDHVFAQSVYTQRLLKNLVPEGRLSMGVPGIDTSVFRPGRPAADPYLLSVARFSDPRKNVAMLFRAYASLRQRMPDAPRLFLAGCDGPTEKDWELARQLDIAAWIEFRKSPSIEELAKLYREALLFVLSSNEEGFGLVLIEAMASGIPVLCTRCGGPESIVEEGSTGYLTPVADANAMAARLTELLLDPDRRARMSVQARRVAEKQFSLEATSGAYVAVYDRLLA